MTDENNELSKEQELQELQYEFPYHYIPQIDANGNFSQTRQWSWGYRYLGGMKVVFDLLEDVKFKSAVDIGCGDGRFLLELKKNHPEVNMLGIDYSQRAIDMANTMNPDISYKCLDITEQNPNKKFDIATLIEVLEHIPPNDIDAFIGGAMEYLNEGGKLILTVPHRNKPAQEKHYQHFNSKDLQQIFDDRFDSLKFVPFDQQSRVLHYLQRLLGGKGSNYVVTNNTVKSLFWKIYTSCYLYTNEKECGRIAMVATK